jgi:hypothetical protein
VWKHLYGRKVAGELLPLVHYTLVRAGEKVYAYSSDELLHALQARRGGLVLPRVGTAMGERLGTVTQRLDGVDPDPGEVLAELERVAEAQAKRASEEARRQAERDEQAREVARYGVAVGSLED